jgi:hypothetical protein
MKTTEVAHKAKVIKAKIIYIGNSRKRYAVIDVLTRSK